MTSPETHPPETHPGVAQWSEARARRVARFVTADAALQELKRCREQITPSLGRSCAAFVDLQGWKFFGAARLSDHAHERFSRTSRWVSDLAAIGHGLKVLPDFERELTGPAGGATGRRPLGRTTATRLARVATPESFGAWLALARRVTARQFAENVSRARAAGSAFPLAEPTSGAAGSGGSGDKPDHCDRTEPDHESAESGHEEDGEEDEDETNAIEIQMSVPGMLKISFDDAVELHRAVSGGHVPVSDFVQALVAEALCAAEPAEIDGVVHLQKGPACREVERHLARKARGWPWLSGETGCSHKSRSQLQSQKQGGKHSRKSSGKRPRRSKADRELEDTCDLLVGEAIKTCRRLQRIARLAGRGKADDLNRQIRDLLQLDDAIERSMGQLLGWMSRHRACAENLFSGVGHYAEERLGMSRRDAQLRAWVDRRLARLPLLRAAYQRGELGLEALRVVLRILHPGPVDRATEATWLEHARQVSVKRLRDEARIRDRKWLENFDAHPPMPADDESWLRSLALFPGTTRRRLQRVAEEERTGGRKYDAGFMFQLRLTAGLADRFLGAIEDRRQRCDAGLETAPTATRLAQLFSSGELPVPTWVGLFALIEEYVDTWDQPEAMPKRRFAEVYGLWGWRCAAPGCTARCSLEAHHLLYLSHGGPLRELWNLVALCSFHHRQGEHGLLATCRGKAPLGIVWRLGHPSVGQWFTNEMTLYARLVGLHRDGEVSMPCAAARRTRAARLKEALEIVA